MKLCIYDPGFPNGANEYVSKMFFAPMCNYGAEEGHDIAFTDSLVPEAGTTLICNADHLNAERIQWFHDNSCPLIAFSCIDSAWLAESIRTIREARLVKKIFMVTGIQNTNISHATVFHADGSITAEPRQFLPDDLWKLFNAMRLEGRLQSLPYVPWRKLNAPAPIPFAEKRPTVLFRGGNHFLRVVAFYVALSKGCADPRSAFQTNYYFADNMVEQFRYCQSCRNIWKGNGGRYPFYSGQLPSECNSEAITSGNLFKVPGFWNNRCPQSFYWLAEQFETHHGNIDHQAVEDALNGVLEPGGAHMEAIAGARFYADAKWEFSINMAYRFWEAASVGTVNLLPQRAADQDYFPQMFAGEHFSTFKNDMSDLSAEAGAMEYQAIANQAQELYQRWMNPEKHAISNSLLGHIFSQIIE